MLLPKVNAVVPFVQDLDRCLTFYRDTLGFELTFSDDVSHAFRLQDQDFVLLQVVAAERMITPEAVAF